jgi:hypothetical protein
MILVEYRKIKLKKEFDHDRVVKINNAMLVGKRYGIGPYME